MDPSHPPTMPGQGETLLGDCEQPALGVTLTDSLITTRNPPGVVEPLHGPTELLSPSTLRLDREKIRVIGRLQSLRETHSLYLQQNQIEKIENLDCFPNLRFLSLAGNCIHRVENLLPLRLLRVLDLSHNQIQALDPAELPHGLRLLDLTGNECTHQQGYRELVLGALPHLLQLDAKPIHGSVGEEEEEGSSSSSEDEDEESITELSSPFTAGKDFFADLHRDLAGHSQQRRREALEEHQARLEELEELRERRALLPPPARLSLGGEGAASPGALAPGRSQPRPHAGPGMLLPTLPGAPGRIQPRPKALEEQTRAKGGKYRQLPQTPGTSTARRGSD